ncbi:hypothetical protein ANCDUO_14328 [Ancylostoma duodenale]|uniref:Uncharacterized protein n=1 Tax=Ancylostoma duodenale TaxID=51022 RepID=A0A0C2G9H1_9BILA|nr:hypothetical protein ANCDUO_14328 [Ancylostoma duodenale]
MIDAFLRDDIYARLRDSLVGDASIPSSSARTYPCIRDFPVSATIQSLKGLHAATQQLTTLRIELFTEIDQWKSLDKVIDALELLARLMHDLDHYRAVLDMYITPLITTVPVEDIQNYVDMLDYHNASPLTILFYYNVATAELAHAYTLHQALTNNLRRLCSSEPQSSEPDVPHTPLSYSPQSNTWTPAITVHSKSNTFLVSPSATVATVTQDLLSFTPPPQTLASTSPPTFTVAAVSQIETATAVLSTSSTTDSDALPAEKPNLSTDLLKISFSLSTPAKYAEQPYRKASASQAAVQKTEAMSSASTSKTVPGSPSPPLPTPPRSSATPREGFHGCFFCSGNHYTAACDAVKSLTDRCYIAANAGRCLRCLYLHPSGQCFREKHCSICGDRDHHPAFCFMNRRSVINDVAGDLISFYKQMHNLAVVKYEDLYMAPRLQ